MPTELTITPTSGNAPFPYQRAPEPGVWEGFDAIDYRRFWSRNYVEGVMAAAAWKVHETTAAPSLQIEVDSNVEPALVQGDSVADQGLYYIPPHAAVATLDIPAPDVTNPRIDRIVLQVRDDEHDGSGAQDARIVLLPGAPTNGATPENEAGVQAVPDGALHLADVEVPANATEVTNANIRDYRTFALKDAKIGDIRFSASASPGDGWVPADWRELNRKQHHRLFAEVGTAFGVGDGSTTFRVPDSRGRGVIGVDTTSGRGPTRNLGDAGGHHEHQLTEAQMPAHGHGVNDPGHEHSADYTGGPNADYFAHWSPGDVRTADRGNPGAGAAELPTYRTSPTTAHGWTGISIQSRGGNSPHNNMQPFLATGVYVFTGSVAS